MTRAERHAFTLIEVMIVVVVLAILAALAAPMFGQAHETTLRTAAQLLAADLAYAQIESIAHGDDPRIVTFDSVAHRYFIAAQSAPATPITNPVGNVPYEVVFGQGRAATMAGVTIQGYALNGDAVLGFGLYGQTDQSDVATITLALLGRSVTVSVDPISGEATVGSVN